jgi:outer membrane biosynthesis protein TonB
MDKQKLTTMGAVAGLTLALGSFGAVTALAHSSTSSPTTIDSALFAREVRADATSEAAERAAEDAAEQAAEAAAAAPVATTPDPSTAATPVALTPTESTTDEETTETADVKDVEHPENKGAEESAETGPEQSVEHVGSDDPGKSDSHPDGAHTGDDGHGGVRH